MQAVGCAAYSALKQREARWGQTKKTLAKGEGDGTASTRMNRSPAPESAGKRRDGRRPL